MKRQRMATGFLHTSAIQANGKSANVYYDWIGPSYIKGLHDFCAYFHEVHIHSMF